jgi:hypothetical protein
MGMMVDGISWERKFALNGNRGTGTMTDQLASGPSSRQEAASHSDAPTSQRPELPRQWPPRYHATRHQAVRLGMKEIGA